MKRFLFVMALLLAYTVSGMAQTDRQYIRSGNKYYRQLNFVKAEAEYRKSLSVNPENPQALYNLGCALVMQKKDSVAVQQFEKAAKIETGRMRKAKIYHNIGFVCQSHKLYGDAINAYKESLRNNPADNETRYNLALCQRLNKSEQNRNKNNQNKDKNKDKQKKDKDKKQDQNKDKNNNKQDKENKEKQQEKMSRDNAEQLLNAAMQNEQATQRRVKDAMRQTRSRKLDKNW